MRTIGESNLAFGVFDPNARFTVLAYSKIPIRSISTQQSGGLADNWLKREILFFVNFGDFILSFGLFKVIFLKAVENISLKMFLVF